MKWHLILSISLALGLSGCIPPPDSGPRRPNRPIVRPATPNLRQCLADLDRLRARYTLLPEQDFGGGCSQHGTIQLLSAGIPVSNVKAVQCGVARTLALWLNDYVQPAAENAFGSRVVKLESMGAYSCRNIIGNPAVAGNRSEHATGNAIDIGGFVLADGRRITIQNGWNGTAEEHDFLRAVRAGGCKKFQTVLSPDYNAAHHDHLHFDMGRGPFCR